MADTKRTVKDVILRVPPRLVKGAGVSRSSLNVVLDSLHSLEQ